MYSPVEAMDATTTLQFGVKTPQFQALPPILNKVAMCESGGRQFNENGHVLRGVVNHKDVGLFQINEDYHLASATYMGLNIYTEEGNRAYALALYNSQGLAPWKASKYCWSKPSLGG